MSAREPRESYIAAALVVIDALAEERRNWTAFQRGSRCIASRAERHEFVEKDFDTAEGADLYVQMECMTVALAAARKYL